MECKSCKKFMINKTIESGFGICINESSFSFDLASVAREFYLARWPIIPETMLVCCDVILVEKEDE